MAQLERRGPVYYTGRDMKTSHKGMQIGGGNWSAFLSHLDATLLVDRRATEMGFGKTPKQGRAIRENRTVPPSSSWHEIRMTDRN